VGFAVEQSDPPCVRRLSTQLAPTSARPGGGPATNAPHVGHITVATRDVGSSFTSAEKSCGSSGSLGHEDVARLAHERTCSASRALYSSRHSSQ
jgi:hypothetical protein